MNQMVTIPIEEYEALLAAKALLAEMEMAADVAAYDRARVEGGPSLSDADVGRILDGESPLRVYREGLGLSQAQLARMAGVHRVTVAEVETGRKRGSVATLAALAKALGLAIDDLV